MSIHIHLIDPPDYYTNLDTVSGQVGFTLSRPESVGAVVVKLEGEASTALIVPTAETSAGWTYRNKPLDDADVATKDPSHPRPSAGAELKETHKILYQVVQAYPPKMGDSEKKAPAATILQAGRHTFPFQFELPFNNTCANPSALSRSGVGLGDTSGIRVMNGTKQLLLRHIRQTLPPSYGESSGQVEIRYFVKVTVQRPGLFKENWRHQLGFRFMPIEPPRPPPTTREVFARRPFAFRARAAVPLAIAPVRKKSSSFFGRGGSTSSVGLTLFEPGDQLMVMAPKPREFAAGGSGAETGRLQDGLAPAIQMSALLPFPAILTWGQAGPLGLRARKLQPSPELVYLTGLEVRLVGTMRLVAQDLQVVSKTSWVLLAQTDLAIAVCTADGPVDNEIELSNELWRSKTLPSSVVPNFRICNASREYELEVRITLSWGLPSPATAALRAYRPLSTTATKQEKKTRKEALKALQAQPAQMLPQTVRFPLNFAAVEVYSGIRPTAALVAAVSRHRELQGLQEQRQLRQHQQVRDENEDSDSDGSDSSDNDDDDDDKLYLREMGKGQQQAGVHEMPLPTSPAFHEPSAQQLEAVGMPALPPRKNTVATRQMTIRRRPVPQQQQAQEQAKASAQNRNSMQKNGSTPCDQRSPQQQYHLCQQQTDPQPQPQALLPVNAFDPLYPPQLQAGLDDDEGAYDDPPPTYDEAMTSVLDLGGGVGSDRPADRRG
ncbi:arrestin n-terminal domain containing protein [Grosmannia clavigera kw1407]|uniref:Arrestin n-terminal domain containing protein n=1 Tax=Grosmannia clavigera (strain kw1407 / UAMH 11150) TaxID=655863 RepID=F0XH67_GROCL|nr:arrestin n-terminal domain containing protein [Grosmannia clavigera kw1407]EFX02984.1 arrestin n-terminal domain containing protein [Grosmannia clavigera kw1407]